MINDEEGHYEIVGDLIKFKTQNDFVEKNCYFSKFNSEYIFCCAISNFIKCYIINTNTYNITKEFSISKIGNNSHLTIKSNAEYLTFFFMNNYNDINSVFEYYIYIPICENKSYILYYNNNLYEKKDDEKKERLNKLFEVKTNKYYIEFPNPPNLYGYFALNNERIFNRTLIPNNDYILDFVMTTNELTSNQSIIVDYIISVEDESVFSKECQIEFKFKTCYKSCETCSEDDSNSNETQHNCLTCNKNYFHSPKNNKNCYLEEEKEINWYLDLNNLKFEICNEECRSCSGPTNFNCTSCKNGFYLFNGNCIAECTEGYFSTILEKESESYFICNKCYINCKTCSSLGNGQNMSCQSCKENQIKYNNNCFEIKNNEIKSFLDPENDSMITNCFKKYGLYIKEDSNECIPFPIEDEGYFISNNETGLLSKCHDNCNSCNNGPIKDDSGIIKSMECLKCKDANKIEKTMIQNDSNCFKIIQYNESKIEFNISEILSDNQIGSCKYFGKAIYYGEYECINKPKNTYYVLNKDYENTGVIKNCHEACNTCLGGGNDTDRNCYECAEGYFKTEDSQTNCLSNDSISLDEYYLNKTNNIYYHCFQNCKGCNDSFNIITKEMYCFNCIDNYYFIFDEYNCYNHSILEDNKYYFDSNDSKYHKCYYSCSKCLNYVPNETNHYCIECAENY